MHAHEDTQTAPTCTECGIRSKDDVSDLPEIVEMYGGPLCLDCSNAPGRIRVCMGCLTYCDPDPDLHTRLLFDGKIDRYLCAFCTAVIGYWDDPVLSAWDPTAPPCDCCGSRQKGWKTSTMKLPGEDEVQILVDCWRCSELHCPECS